MKGRPGDRPAPRPVRLSHAAAGRSGSTSCARPRGEPTPAPDRRRGRGDRAHDVWRPGRGPVTDRKPSSITRHRDESDDRRKRRCQLCSFHRTAGSAPGGCRLHRQIPARSRHLDGEPGRSHLARDIPCPSLRGRRGSSDCLRCDDRQQGQRRLCHSRGQYRSLRRPALGDLPPEEAGLGNGQYVDLFREPQACPMGGLPATPPSVSGERRHGVLGSGGRP